jgi:hypothetical protein
MQRDDDRALADFNESIRHDPNNASAYFERGDQYHRNGDRRARSEIRNCSESERLLAKTGWLPEALLQEGRQILRIGFILSRFGLHIRRADEESHEAAAE